MAGRFGGWRAVWRFGHIHVFQVDWWSPLDENKQQDVSEWWVGCAKSLTQNDGLNTSAKKCSKHANGTSTLQRAEAPAGWREGKPCVDLCWLKLQQIVDLWFLPEEVVVPFCHSQARPMTWYFRCWKSSPRCCRQWWRWGDEKMAPSVWNVGNWVEATNPHT